MSAKNRAIVLSGGGVRGAYEAGLIAGVVEILGLRAGDPAPFGIFTGTSVGAINAAFLAANADRGDLDAEGLCAMWRALKVEEMLRPDRRSLSALLRALTPFGLGRRAKKRRADSPLVGYALLDPSPVERLVREGVDLERLHHNVEAGRVHALVLAALEIGSGVTTLFAELAPDAEFRASPDPYRRSERCRMSLDHVLASAAIPVVFPGRRIGRSHYCDGGVRFNTPIAPAIRCGADHLLVVSLMHREAPRPVDETARYDDPFFLLGKLFDVLLLDPVQRDLQVLERFNRLLETLEARLTPEAFVEVKDALSQGRCGSYRTLEVLRFTPSADIGVLAGGHIRQHLGDWDLNWIARRLLKMAARGGPDDDADLASFVLFDGGFAARLIDLGRADAHARAEAVRAHFR